METPTPVTEPRFVDDQNDIIDPLPVFVTRTTLRAAINEFQAKKLSHLASDSISCEIRRTYTLQNDGE